MYRTMQLAPENGLVMGIYATFLQMSSPVITEKLIKVSKSDVALRIKEVEGLYRRAVKSDNSIITIANYAGTIITCHIDFATGFLLAHYSADPTRKSEAIQMLNKVLFSEDLLEKHSNLAGTSTACSNTLS